MTGPRFFRHGELPLVIVALLSRRAMNAYQLIAAIEDAFDGAYEPSTGAVYPAVSALRAEALLADEGGGAGRTYRLTERGRRALDARRDDLAALELRTGARLVPDDSLDGVLQAFVHRARQLAQRVDRRDVEATIERATRELERLSGKEASGQ